MNRLKLWLFALGGLGYVAQRNIAALVERFRPHLAHAHNAETSDDSLGGLDAKSMAKKNKEQEQG